MVASGSVPVIDLLIEDTPEKLAAALSHALHTVGFIFITNHGLEDSSAKTFEIAEDFFCRETLSEKERCKDVLNKGYSAIGQEVLDPVKLPEGDKKEAFNLSNLKPNILDIQPLPPTISKHTEHLIKFKTQCFELCQKLLVAFAIALDISPTYFSDQHDEDIFSPILRFLRYHTLPADAVVNPIRAGARSSQPFHLFPSSSHSSLLCADSDYGSLTLLFQREAGGEGLQILPSTESLDTGHWKDVGVVPGAVIVNVGDALELWTGGKFKSTLHRVVIPEEKRGEAIGERYSIAYFNQPVPDARLESLVPPAEISQLDRERMERKGVNPGVTITASEHLQARLDATYKQRNAVLAEYSKRMTATA